MRRLSVLIAFTVLLSCKEKPKSKLIKYKYAKAVKKEVNPASTNTLDLSKRFPADTIYKTRLLTAEGVAHQEEVDPKSSEYKWVGIFKTDTGYYIADTKIKLLKAHDEVLDEREKDKTGWLIKPSVKDSSILLISGTNYLVNGPIKVAKLPKKQLMPGEHQQFFYNDVDYTLYATGLKKPESPNSNAYIITDYKLFLKATVKGKSYNQLLVSTSGFDETLTTILFIADIDGDSVPDFIIDTSNDYNTEMPTLYLSKPASKNELLKVVGMHTYVGC